MPGQESGKDFSTTSRGPVVVGSWRGLYRLDAGRDGTVVVPPVPFGHLHGDERRFGARPGGAGGDGVTRLLWRIEELLDSPALIRLGPAAQQAADGPDIE